MYSFTNEMTEEEFIGVWLHTNFNMLLWPKHHSTQLVKLLGYEFMWSHEDFASVQSRF
jgi:hypothetical protein